MNRPGDPARRIVVQALLLWALALLGLSPAGCDRQDPTQATVTLRLTLPTRTLAKSGDPRPIEENPLVLWASIDAEDMAAPATGLWAGGLDQDPALELTAEAGTNRILSVMLLSLAGNRIETYRALETGLDLSPGDQTLSVALERAPEWTLEAELVPGDEAPTEAAVMEVQTRVVFPAAPVQEEHGRFSVTLDHLPVGRFFYLLVRSADGSWSDPLTACPLWSGKEGNVARTITLPDGSC